MTAATTTTRGGALRVNEIFGPTIQGEGAQIGRPTVFVRLFGCDYRCAWCDSMYAVDPKHRATGSRLMSADEILEAVEQLAGEESGILITLSGGNPALQPCLDLIAEGQARGYTFTMETQGSRAQPWFGQLDHLCLSPKPPSSRMATSFDTLADCLYFAPTDTILKVVVFDADDYAYARSLWAWAQGIRAGIPMYLQVGNLTPEPDRALDVMALLACYRRLIDRTVADGWYAVRVLPQLHTLVWGNDRGV